MTALLSTSTAAAAAGRLWRAAVTGTAPTAPVPAPVVPADPTLAPGAHLQDRLKSARTSIGFTWCRACDVTWKGPEPCFLCGSEPSTTP